MPTLPPYFRPPAARTKQERGQDHDWRRSKEQPSRKWYSLAIWRNGIRPAQLARKPLCERCEKSGTIREATIVNHVGGHQGIWERFVSGPFESLCKTHHDADVQREEAAARKAKRMKP